MLDKTSELEPVIGPDDRPDEYSDFFGSRARETMHFKRVPALAQHIVAMLPAEYEFLQFSAIVYRYRSASPWILDLLVFGLDPEDRDSELGEMVAQNVQEKVEAYNWEHHGIRRFVLGGIQLLNPAEQQTVTPGTVSVRPYYRHRKAGTQP